MKYKNINENRNYQTIKVLFSHIKILHLLKMHASCLLVGKTYLRTSLKYEKA